MNGRATAILPAAGRGTRCGGSLPKQFAALGGRPVIEHALAAFERATRIADVVVAVAKEYHADVASTLSPKFPKLRCVVEGGVHRQSSVERALAACAADNDAIVVVHDAARPFVRPETIDRCVAIAEETGACIVARPVHDTVKQVDASGRIMTTVDRNGLWCAETPQAFRMGLLRQAYAAACRDHFIATDEAALVERLGIAVHVMAGDAWNLKITSPEDLAIAEAFMKSFPP